nr:ribonuclease H-like domain-containing protein [Tanacetum cinerariifolium]
MGPGIPTASDEFPLPKDFPTASEERFQLLSQKDATTEEVRTADEVKIHISRVVTDDFSRFSWTFFLKTKDETSGILRNFITEIENMKDLKVKIIRCDNGGEFRNKEMNDFCSRKGIKREFSNARTPQQNGVAERRNRTVIEVARIMLADAKLSVTFWAEAVNTACYVQNRVFVNKSQNKTPYELFNGRTPAIGFLKPFGCHVMILNTLDHLGKFEAKGDKGTTSTNFSRTKEAASQDVKKDVSSLRYIALPNWFHEAHLETSKSNAQDACKADAPESSGISNPTTTSTNPLADQTETLTVETPILTEEGIDYKEVFALVARIEAIRLFLAYASFIGFTVYHMDMKSAFLYGTIDEEVYVMQPPGFQDPEFPARVYKVEKAMYGLHQAPKAWYGTLSKYLLTNGFQRGTINQTLFIRKHRGDFLLVQVYVDNIIFGSSNPQLCKEFEALMHEKFQMSAMVWIFRCHVSEYFHGQGESLGKRRNWHQVTPKECHVHAVKRIFRYLKTHPKLGIWYPKDSPFNLVAYSDSDYGGATQDRKSTTGGCQFLGSACHERLCLRESHHLYYFCKSNYLWLGYRNLLYWGVLRILMISLRLIPLFWSTARIETMDEGTNILATVDGELRTIFESSIRRNLKLNDEAGISSLPDAELFEHLAMMGVNSPSFLGRTVPLFATMLVHQGEGSGTSTEPHHTPSPEAQHLSPTAPSSPTLPPATTESIPTVIPTDIPPLRQYIKRARIAQSFALPTTVDEPASPLGDDSQGEAFPTISGLSAEQDRENIIKTSTLPHDSPPRVTSLATDEGSMQHKLNELTDLYTRLQRQQTQMALKITAQDLEIASLKARIKMLEDKDREGAEPSGEDTTIKGRSLETGEEAGVDKSTERGSNDIEELVNVLIFLDAGNILTSEGVQVVSVPPAIEVSTVSVPTGSGMVSTASLIFTTTSVVTPYLRRKGKEKMVKSDTPKKKKLQEQIDVQVTREMEEQLAREDQRIDEQIFRDAEIARIHAEEELQVLIDGLDRNNETVAKYLQEYEQFAKDLSIGERIELINDLVKYQDNYAKVLKFKRKGLRLEQDSAKKVKTSEEVSKEDLKTMMQLVPVEEVYVEALQVKHPIIDWEIHTKGQRICWKIIRLGGNTAVYQFFIDMLKHFDREGLNQLWTLMKETLSIRHATSDKEKELWVDLKRLYEPDVEDQLWTQTQALMHNPVEWRLYDTCGVHHVLSIDQEIFTLVERDYPLRKGLAIVMISNKLQMENYSQMANDLILKIHKIANSIPTASDEFPLPEDFPTASEEWFPLLREKDVTAKEVRTADEVK